MSIIEFFREYFNRIDATENDFVLRKYREGFFIGYDSEGIFCVVIDSDSTSTCPIRQKTKVLSIDCNEIIDRKEVDSNITEEKIVHIIRCSSEVAKEQELFLELVNAMIPDSKTTDERVVEVFQTLVRFFADKSEPSENELVGLFAEVDAIIHFSQYFPMGDYWQSKDRMKFDFSFSDKLKLEVKATRKENRLHHFRHEQLATDLYDIFVLSYKLRYDDNGVSLYDALNNVKPLIANNYQKLTRVNTILKNVSTERLMEMKYSPEYTDANRVIFKAPDIPRFIEVTPEGVANAEYDCNLETAPHFDEKSFVDLINKTIQEANNGL